ncbi:tigger transposable element-derived protein 2-like [Belonocnema kinseyi]|uniref:tigger transposable element-derived protein 2-like n=1 Tax=Belonocnema kinseyi TaxID=2817044 RepID=UPI00143DAF40|nr:tigger transposable element-derived protein 2-like [Belonocnema kinseyi]
MPKVKKWQRLSFKEEYELAGEVKAGASKEYVLQKYGINKATCNKALAREADSKSKVINYDYQNKKLDAAVFEWYKQARDSGDPLSGPIIQEKARSLNEQLHGPQSFKASNGWLEGFRRRYGIWSTQTKVEKMSNNRSSAAEFSKVLKTKIESENLILDNIYNSDESGILWRLLTAYTPALHQGEDASGKKESKGRVTALFCANASGTHQIPLLIIGKSKNPNCLSNLITKTSKRQRFKKLESLGVTYTYQKSAWMEKSIFLLWYKDEFIPRVLERQSKDGITGKIVLLLDDSPSHPSLDELNAINENIEVVCFPPNVTALVQPMTQGIISTTKKLFKKDMLRRMLSEESEGAVQFLKELDLPDCFRMLNLAWDSLEKTTLQKAWKPLLGDLPLPRPLPPPEPNNIKLEEEEEEDVEEDPLPVDDAVVSESDSRVDVPSSPHEIRDQVSENLPGQDNPVENSKEFLVKWLENDGNDKKDCGSESSRDSDVVNFATNGFSEPEIVPEIVPKIENSETMFEEPDIVNFVTCGRLESEIVNKNEEGETIIENSESMEITSSSEAFGCLMKLKSWAQSRPECLPKHLDCITELKNLITER